MTRKLIISSHSSLTKKYQTSGRQRIEKELTNMITADAKRGITTTLHFVDLAPYHAKNQKDFKNAVDALYGQWEPEYIMLLGADDVVPHQTLPNPTPGDGDPDLPSDLPYASNNPYSTLLADFLNPTRVLGRLPDLHGNSHSNVTYFLNVIRNAIQQKPLSWSSYNAYFSVSAKVWTGSTKKSIQNIFGRSRGIHTCPPNGPNWTSYTYAKRVHFINCHGAAIDPNWYGEFKGQFPIALQSTRIAGKIKSGTVVAAECCYGAQLYSLSGGTTKGLCNQYIEEGTAGFFGSTNIAYGPPNGQGLADIITQRFIRYIRQGASVGRAALQARQYFIQQAGAVLNPFQLKTVGQFILLGDPSIHPVATEKAMLETTGTVMMKSTDTFSRVNRRRELAQMGQQLLQSKRLLRPTKAKIHDVVFGKIEDVIQEKGLSAYSLNSFRIEDQSPFEALAPMTKGTKSAPRSKIHTLIAQRSTGVSGADKTYFGFVFVEENNKLLEYTEYHSK